LRGIEEAQGYRAAERQTWLNSLRPLIDGESVEVRLVAPAEEQSYVTVKGREGGRLFDQVLGAVVYALGKNSDNLVVDRVS